MNFEQFEKLASLNGSRTFFKPLAVQTRLYAKKHFGDGDPPVAERLKRLFHAVREDVGFYVDVREDTPVYTAGETLRTRVNEWTRDRGDLKNALSVYYWLNFYAPDHAYADHINSEVLSDEEQDLIRQIRNSLNAEKNAEFGNIKPSLEGSPFGSRHDYEYSICQKSVREIDRHYLLHSRWTLAELLERAPSESAQYKNIVESAAHAAVEAHELDAAAQGVRRQILSKFRDDCEHYIDLAKRYKEVEFEFGDPSVIPFGRFNEREIGLAFYEGGDNWFGEVENGQPGGIGIWRIFSVFIDTHPNEPEPVNELSGTFSLGEPCKAVYRFANGSTFLGEWRNSAPHLGLMITSSSNIYTIFLGPMGAHQRFTGHPDWGPAGVGVATLQNKFLSIAQLQLENIISPHTKIIIEERKFGVEEGTNPVSSVEDILQQARSDRERYTGKELKQILREAGLDPTKYFK